MINKTDRGGFFVVLILLFCISGPAEAVVPDSLIQRADSLYKAYEEKKSLNTYQQILERDSTYFPAWWKSSLLYARIGFTRDSDEDKRRYYKKSLSAAQKALSMRPDHVQSHFVMGVAMGRQALIASARERVAASRKIKQHAEQALQADSEHAGAHHLLGRWHLEVTNLNFAERAAANWLFGGLPEGSLEKAISHLDKATTLDPGFILYWYDLGRAYNKDGKRGQALEALQRAVDLEPKLESDKHYHNKAQTLYQELK